MGTGYITDSTVPPNVDNGLGQDQGHVDEDDTYTNGEDISLDELTAMSQTLLGNQFTEMDRVFTLNGTDFTYGLW